MLLFCLLVTGLTLAILGMAQFAAVVRFWPYNLELTLAHYSFELEGVGLRDFFNSLVMAGSAAVFGTALVFIGAFVVEKPRRDPVVTTLSAVIFLYGPETKVASAAAIHMDEAGETASAAAMAMLIVYACAAVRVLHAFVTGWLLARVQAWRRL